MIYRQLFIGIDISKFKHDIAVYNEYKKIIHKPFVIQENHKDYQRLLAKLNRLKEKYQTETFHVGMEATSDYWKNLYHFLKKQSDTFMVTVINPVRTKAFAKTELRRAKTDPVNAKDIGLFMVEKRPKPSIDREPIFDRIKDIDTQICQFKKQQSMTLNKLRLELAKVAPEIEHATKDITGQQILALLHSFPTAEAIRLASVEELKNLRYGKKNWRLSQTFIEKMKRLAENSIAHKTGVGAGYVVQALVKRVLQYQQGTELLGKQITELYQKISEHDSLLCSIKGISKETAIVLEAYIGDASRFRNAKKVVAYFGMNPVVDLSGTSKKRTSYLEKKGSGIVRHKLYMAILSIIAQKKGVIYEYYTRLVDSGKPKLVAIAAAMRKLLVIIYTMLKNQKPYNSKISN